LTRFLGIERQNKQTNKTLAECKHAHRRESRVLRLLHTQKSKEKKRKEKRIQLQSGGGEMRRGMGPREIRNRVQTVEEKETRKWNFVLTRCRHARRATVAASQQKKKIP
jgi:hypothetical protein